ncbi:hypothetical protein P1P68_12630 [Streptomyces scabiei]|uniref:hypothetical protein n=1 Tax=Streptomyces scabiei TaxID=1930 RepID=UPI00298FAE7D|nr:hypothetical protein [Streptomyces scabiei]MDW8805604.1 hypothetical protein [Streptomyces scabiei]
MTNIRFHTGLLALAPAITCMATPGKARRKHTSPAIDPAADRLINEAVTANHPHMRPSTSRPTTVCGCGAPAVRVDTGQLGNRYGVCFDCAQDWQYVSVRREDAPQVAALARSLYLAAARQAADATPTEPTTCTVYPGLCTAVDGEDGDTVDEHGRHVDHAGATLSIPGHDIPDDPNVWAYFLHLSDSTPKIGVMGDDLTPAQAHQRAAELRRFADGLDALAVQVAAVCTEQAGDDQ